MKEQPVNPNVVQLGDRKTADRRGGGLLTAVNDITIKHSRELVATLFEHVDDALFDLAEKAESNAVQTRYFDGMRDVRRKRQLIERLYVDNVRERLGRFANGKLEVPGKNASRDHAGRDGELSLVEESELEESLAVTSMSSKAESRYARTLYAVNQRLSVISGGSKVTDANNPIGPVCLCDAFRVAMAELDADINVKLIIYKLYERYVIAGLDQLYEAVNNHLVKAGVLPQLRRDTRARRTAQSADAEPNRDSRQTPSEVHDGISSADEDLIREQLYSTVNELLANRRQITYRGQEARSAAPALGVSELIAALALLQQQAPPVPAEPTLTEAGAGSLSLEELKAALQQQIANVSENTKARVSGADEDTIDLVGMLFEYILEDRNLPAQMQALLGRLQIPYLKVAILDKHLFAKHSHPARRLLDRLAEAAKGWSKEADQDLRLFNQVKSTVETLLHDADDDAELFPRLLEQFETFTASTDTRAERAEKRAADAVKGREKLQAARHAAAREVFGRTRDATPPDLIRNILARPWANYLVLTALRQGEDSAEWRTAVRFIDDLIASTRTPHSDAERQAIRTALPHIEKTLRHGLAAVAFNDNDVRRLMRALGRFYLGLLGETPAGEEPLGPMASEAASEAVIPESVEALPEPEPAIDISATPATAALEDSPAVQQARALKLGNWVEFVTANGQRERAKLSWISPISGKYLFVNRRGLKVCDMTLELLANGISDGSTVILEEVPLFDRALDAIVERLKNDQRGDAQNAAADLASGPPTPAAPPASDDTPPT